MIRKLVSLFGLVSLAGSVAFAQARPVFSGSADAYTFAYGGSQSFSPPPLVVDLAGGPTSAGVATLTVAFGTVSLTDGTLITPLSTLAPITVGVGANRETVTPTVVSCSTPQVYQSCSFTATFTYQHGTGDRIASASYGIQEAGLYLAGKYAGGLVIISPALLQAAGITTNAGVTTLVGGFNSVGTRITLLNYSGIPGALSYQATLGSAYASTTHVIY